MKPEQYNEFGEIIETKPPRTYERRLNAYDTHRIHETKDMFESSCSYCQVWAKKIRSYWEEQERLDAES